MIGQAAFPVGRGDTARLVGTALAALILGIALLALDLGRAAPSRVPSATLAAKDRAARAYGHLPLRFEANVGQTDPRVRFIARGAGYTLFLTAQGSVLSLAEPAPRPAKQASVVAGGARAVTAPAKFATVRMRLIGGKARVRLSAITRLPGITNYMVGPDPKAWHTHVPSYASALARGVYPGVDLLYHGRQGHLEYDFRLGAGANPGAITLAFSGARKLSLDRAGNLVLDTAAGVLREDRPTSFQQWGGRRHAIAGRFVIHAGDRVGFRLGPYDRARPLVIDPALVYSTYLGGGTSFNAATAIAADSSGAAYVVGFTGALDFPTTTGALQPNRAGDPANPYSSDAFVTKLNPAGSALVYSTYLGGPGSEFANAVAVDASGRAYVAGTVQGNSGAGGTAGFPTTAGAFQATDPTPLDSNGVGFVSVLNANGSALDYSTYLGGPATSPGDQSSSAIAGIAIDPSGHAYVTGVTSSSTFPTKAPAPAAPYQSTLNGSGNAFAAELDPSASGAASLVYSTYLGGSNFDQGAAIAVDAAGDAYVAGLTGSTDFPVKNAFQATYGGGNYDGFVTELDPTGSALAYSTYLGGSDNDMVGGIALDSTAHAYVTGTTRSTNFPTKNAFQPEQAGNPPVDGTHDAFVTKLDPAASGASSLMYSSYLGGAADDTGAAIAVSSSGAAYVAGAVDLSQNATTTPGTFPMVDPLAAPASGGDVFLAAVKPDGSGLSFSTYLGGGGEDDLRAGGLALDPAGNAYLAGETSSTDFPTLSAVQPQNPGAGLTDREEAFVAKVAPVPPAAPLVTGLSHRSGPDGTLVVIGGHGFSGATAVRFGATAASTFTVNSDTQITATAPAGAPGPVVVTVSTPQGSSPPNPIATFTYARGTWTPTGSMRVASISGQTATLLADGRVLVAGGLDAFSNAIGSAELYDPTSGTWSTTSSMGTARAQATATLLRDGRVLVAGGIDSNFNPLTSAELYDPSSGTWTPTGSLATARNLHTATLLASGKVLVAGGDGNAGPLDTAELYDPVTGTWSPAGTLADARAEHTATLLTDGRVLVVGGTGTAGSPLSSAELYDPTTNSWRAVDSLTIGRADHTATLLPNGHVLIAGGNAGYLFAPLSSAEIYDPGDGMFTPTASMSSARAGPAAALLPDGRVLVAGGARRNTAELFDPATQTWSSAGVMTHYRGYGGTGGGAGIFALTLTDGSVLAGGDASSAGASTELYNPAGSPGPGPGGGQVPANTAPPSISGSAVAGELLTEVHGSWSSNPTRYAYQWERCDSTGAQCAAISGARAQTYTLTGTDTGHTVRVQESASNAAGASEPASSKQTAVVSVARGPVVTGYRMTNRTFAVAARPTPITGTAARTKHPKQGTTFQYALSEPATVRIVISERFPGRRAGKRCLAPTRKRRHAKRCTRTAYRGKLSRTSRQGANRVAFSGRIGPKALKPGSYQATLTATDVAGRTSKPHTISFTIVRLVG